MVIEKNDKKYIVTECRNNWTVKTESEKLSVSFNISKDLCATENELYEYVLSNNELF